MRWRALQLAVYHELRVEVELKSSEIREKLRALDDVQQTTVDQLNGETKKLKSLRAKAEKLQIARLQCDENLMEVDKKIRYMIRIYVKKTCQFNWRRGKCFQPSWLFLV